MLGNLRIRTKLRLTFALVIVGYSSLLGYVLYGYQAALHTAAQRDAFVLNAVDLARQAQVDFKIQVQEWKNTLLRGLDPKALEKYRAAFGKTEAEVQKQLAALKSALAGAGRDVRDVEKLAAGHKTLGEKYRAALAGYDSKDPTSPQRIDAAVTGIDRAPTKDMDALVASIQAMAVEWRAQATREHERLRTTLLLLALGVSVPFGAAGWWLARSIARPLDDLVARLKDMAEGEGDLTKRLDATRADELGAVARWFNRFVENVHGLMTEVRSIADHAASASQQLSAASGQLSSGAQEQASSLEETAASLEEITGTVKQNADNARQANQLAVGSRDVAEKGGEVVADAVQSMSEINTSSKKIADIITTIDEIAFQTNLLALNAAVEAARAGEQGRGFAVVASEVRNLAQRSATAAKEIKDLIQDSVQKVEAGSELVNKSGATLGEIVGSVKRVTDIIAEIAAASQEQTTGIDQVNKAVMQMDQVTQSNAAQTEELSSTAQALAAQAEQLQALVARFKLGEGKAAVAKAASRAPTAPAAPKVTATSLVKAVAARPAPKKAEPALAGVHDGNGAAHPQAGGFEEF